MKKLLVLLIAGILAAGLAVTPAMAEEPNGAEGEYYFSPELLSNKLFTETFAGFDAASLMDQPEDTGVEICENGDVIFRLYAPDAENVFLLVNWAPLPMEKDDRGMWIGTFPYDPTKTGPVPVLPFIDNTVMTYPYFPVFWTAYMPCNFVEVPDVDMDFVLIKDNPHGAVVEQMYWSSAMNSYERMLVYTPPGYMTDSQEYPVLYLLHGAQDNETSWVYTGRLAHIADNLIDEGKMTPCIIVMQNCELDVEGQNDYHSIDQILMDDVIPFVEANYRVKTDKWDRAVAGLSMGAYATNDICLWHPEMFGYVGQFTASMHHSLDGSEEEGRAYVDSELLRDPEAFVEEFKVFFRSTTPMEDHFEYFEADDALLAEYGIDQLDSYYRTVYEGSSKWYSWRKGVHDYLQLIFQD